MDDTIKVSVVVDAEFSREGLKSIPQGIGDAAFSIGKIAEEKALKQLAYQTAQ